jgi:hypothetical protein
MDPPLNTQASVDIVTTNNTDFPPISISTTLNSLNAYATLVSPGADPTIPTLNRVLNGNRAIRLNVGNNDIANLGRHITTLSRSFIINENTFNYNYSVIMQNPTVEHVNDDQPFLAVRLYDINNNILRQQFLISNINDCIFTNVGTPELPLLFSDWQCGQINTSDLLGQQVRVEFIIADCRRGGHFGTVYIDDLCGTNCAASTSGSINLTPIQTITCPTTTQSICGTFTLPFNGVYENISLNITQFNGFGTNVISTINTPTYLDLTSNTFCFDVPITAFGNNPDSDFEFQVVGNFLRQCGIQGDIPLQAITDNSANDNGADVTMTNCIDAVDDNFTMTTCTLSNFSVLANDTVFGNPATIANTIITQVSPVIPQLSLNTTTGLITVNTGISPGNYSLSYQICNANNASHCSTGVVNVTVLAPQITAEDDDFSTVSINACAGGNTPSVFSNDLFCGVVVNATSVNVGLLNNGGLAGTTINNNGIITIPANVLPGNYNITYQICETGTNTFCDTATVAIVIAQGELPLFNFSTSICNGITAPLLPTTSNNQIVGTWNPTVIDNTTSGTYTFTPSDNCSSAVTIPVTVLADCGLFLEWGSDVSCQLGNDDPRIKFDSDIVDGPCIRVCENSNIGYHLTGDTGSIDFTVWNITGGIVTFTSNTSCTIQWGGASFSAIQAIVHLNDGTTLEINRCVEKLEAPTAKFGALPDITLSEIVVCENSTVVFENLTWANNGHDTIYYFWNFGDGTSSTLFEPTHVYTQSGTYEVILNAFNGCSCVGEYRIQVNVERGIAPIECPSVVCEGDTATYSIPSSYAGNGCDISWNIDGGDLLWSNDDKTVIIVEWNHVDASGFGYVSVGAANCFRCVSTVKVPVVKNEGTITGTTTLCEKAQGLYALPQWPTTEFNWTLDDGGTGATLIQTNQRNEILIASTVAGSLVLRCSYYNTLLRCGGTAEYLVEVKPTLVVTGEKMACKNATHSYSFLNNGNTVSAVNWVVNGPNNFSQSGFGSPFTFTFPEIGIYTMSTSSANYCSPDYFSVEVVDNPSGPTVITGPLTMCPGIPVTYSCVVPNDVTAHWEVVNGSILGPNTGSQVLVNFSPTATTPYLVKVWYEMDECSSTVLETVIEREIPNIAFNTAAQTVCGSSYEVYAIAPLNVDNYVWSIQPASAGSIQTGQNTNEVYVLWNQTPQITDLIVTVRKCGLDYSESLAVTVINAPAITIAGPAATCTNVAETYSFSMDFGTQFTSVLWDFGDGTTDTSTSNTITHTYNDPISASTTYTITATVTKANGCLMPAIATHQVVVAPSPIVTLSPTVNLNLCDFANTPADYTYSVNLQGGFSASDTVQWFLNGNAIPGATNPTIDVANYGVGTYYAAVSNVYACVGETQRFSVINDCNTSDCAVPYVLDGVATITGCGEVTVDVTLVEGTPNEVFISYPSSFTNSISVLNQNQLVANNIEPGEYSVSIIAEYNYNNTICYVKKKISFIIPYKAGLKHTITCANDGTYAVQLLDHSVYYPLTPAQQFEFTTDGTTWLNGPVVNNIAQLNTVLSPGIHQIGIRITRPGYLSCTYFETLELPDYPIATFTNDAFACAGSAMQFHADDDTTGNQYLWDFGNDAINLQQNPVRAFSGSNQFTQVSLTVTNKYGCSATHTGFVTVVPNNMAGALEKNPNNTCTGGAIELYYSPDPGTDSPSTLYWYHNEYTTVPFATTMAPNLSLTVTQNGQYFVYAENSNGCFEYGDIDPVSVAFVPAPEAPAIEGETTVCLGAPIHLLVPTNTAIHYVWTQNGTAMPAWNGFTAIHFLPTVAGSYVFTAVAQSQADNGDYCSSAPATFTVTVLEAPVVPEIEIVAVICNPYVVVAEVANPQNGMRYYWSNGETGISATITHDGPLQVRAEANGCSATAQIDLPVDLAALAWIFPNGCFETCDVRNPLGSIIPPFGVFTGWTWLENGNTVASGTGEADPYDAILGNATYQLQLQQDNCTVSYGTAAVTQASCEECELRFEVLAMDCVTVNGVFAYQISFDMNNGYSGPLTVALTAPNGEGYFVSSSFTLPYGNSIQTLYFYPLGGFQGGNVSLHLNGTSEKGVCFTATSLRFVECKRGRLETINNAARNYVTVAPNPAYETTTISYAIQSKGKLHVEVMDMMGRSLVVYPLQNTQGSLELPCSAFAAGYYYVVVKEDGVLKEKTKLIIQ